MVEVIKELIGELREHTESDRGAARRACWEPAPATSEIRYYTVSDLPRRGVKGIPFSVFAGMTFWHRALGINLCDYYADPLYYLESFLRVRIEHLKCFDDCMAVTKVIPISFGVALESSLFGVEPTWMADQDPWDSPGASAPPLLADTAALDSLAAPDFRRSGLMPRVHRFYETISELLQQVAPDFRAAFPIWYRSPFGIACTLRGTSQLLMDMLERPAFVHRLMSFVTDARLAWETERSKYLGVPLGRCSLGNDEVNCPMLSPALYEEFVLPYEKRLSDFHGGIAYWHSCGEITRLLPAIRRSLPIDLLHVSPWTDLATAIEEFKGTGTRFHVWLHPIADVLTASTSDMWKRMERLIQVLEAHDRPAVSLVSGHIQPLSGLPNDLAQIRHWVAIWRSAGYVSNSRTEEGPEQED